MKKLLSNSLLLSLFCFPFTTQAEDIPKSTKYDYRVKNVIYNPDNITRINVSSGITTLIQFSPSEYITETEGGAAIGDPLAWKVNIRGNNVWIRPAAEEPDTNLTIVTNKRTYLFNLVSVSNRNKASWSVRFSYPEPKKEIINPWAKPCSGGTYNYRYFAKGDKNLFPIEVWDNGIFTCMAIKPGTDMPVVFKKLPDGKEGLVNSHIENGYIVIHEVNPEYRLRLGDLVAGIKTDRLKALGTNFNGTTNGKVRGIINE
ncbi:TrbG/VirB9 family P-type conjugative transfer protein [Volucribacter amazonae]|uniref:Conjugal transfer protein TraH n=1 Tax=Volucribacter amazonae TaxID=256731 RepID=A0A9X4PDW2_9PAST|nr:TrbG/VirB9 family P-type conjugative transfer protein [Volucribacter amazonae]MDG6896372.1 conjugal transfer protein TraH [Volucribacter amazonae]MDG6896414.1 conjugal transfer protein TraH [Volucribacter amazonae]